MTRRKKDDTASLWDDVNGFFEVNQEELDKEWVQQPHNYYDYAVQLADAKLALEEHKSSLDVVRADCDLHIRANPEEYNLEKVTEKVVESTILQQEDYSKALKRVQKAKYEVDLLAAAVQALDQKKHALQNLVSLHGQNYFASPQVNETGREVVGDLEKRSARRRSIRTRS